MRNSFEELLQENNYWIGNYRESFGRSIDHEDWIKFSGTWDGLPPDLFMADGGKYRSRRFSEFIYDMKSGGVTALPHGPFYQSKHLNNLNGGIQRHFDPITPFIASHPLVLEMVGNYCKVFSKIIPSRKWRFYLHQVRISAFPGAIGKPSPEGIHKDGVSFSTLFCVNRKNADGAVNVIYDNSKIELESAVLNDTGECIVFNDSEVYHYVTPMDVSAGENSAVRDMLFIEFTAVV